MCKGNESISFTFLPSGANEVHFRNSLKCSNSVKASSHFNTVFSAQKIHLQNVILHWKNSMVSGHIRFAKDFPAKHFRSPSLQGTSCSTFGSLLCINFFCQLARKIFPPSSSFPSRCNFRWERFWKASSCEFSYSQQNELMKNDAKGEKKWHLLIQLRPRFNEFRSWKEGCIYLAVCYF